MLPALTDRYVQRRLTIKIRFELKVIRGSCLGAIVRFCRRTEGIRRFRGDNNAFIRYAVTARIL